MPQQDDGRHRLVLLRHAKSSWNNPGLDDHQRPLNARGRQAADLLAAHFATKALPNLILCSSAKRTRQTLAPLLDALPEKPPVLIEDGLYLASATTMLKRLAQLDDDVADVMVIAHNPGLHELAVALAAHSPRRLAARIVGKYPTGAAATYRFSGPWSGIAHAAIILTDVVTPADLSSEIERDD